MIRIEFTPEALCDLESIRDYIKSSFGQDTATKNLSIVMREIKTLKQFPQKGSGIWERYGIDSDYRYFYSNMNYVFYRVEDDVVKIIRVLDARRDFLSILFGKKQNNNEEETE